MAKKITPFKRSFIITLCLCVAVFVSCSPDPGTEGKNKVALVTSLEESPYHVEVKIFRLPESARDMSYMSYSLNMGKDGFLYFGIGNNHQNGHLFPKSPSQEAK